MQLDTNFCKVFKSDCDLSKIENLSPDLIITSSGNSFNLTANCEPGAVKSPNDPDSSIGSVALLISLLLILRSGDGNEPIWPLLVRGLYDATYIIPPYSLIPTGT